MSHIDEKGIWSEIVFHPESNHYTAKVYDNKTVIFVYESMSYENTVVWARSSAQWYRNKEYPELVATYEGDL